MAIHTPHQIAAVNQDGEDRRLSDGEVVAEVLSGNALAYEILITRYSERLFRLARTLTRDQEVAEDILQFSWLKAYRQLGDVRDGIEQWMTNEVTRACLTWIKAGGRRRKDTWDPHRADALTRVGEALLKLSPEFLKAYLLRVIEERSYHDVAQALNTSLLRAYFIARSARKTLDAVSAREVVKAPDVIPEHHSIRPIVLPPIVVRSYSVPDAADIYKRLTTVLGERDWLVKTRHYGPFRINAQIANPTDTEALVSYASRDDSVLEVNLSKVVSTAENLERYVILGVYPSGEVRGISGSLTRIADAVVLVLSEPLCVIDPALPNEDLPTSVLRTHVDVLLFEMIGHD